MLIVCVAKATDCILYCVPRYDAILSGSSNSTTWRAKHDITRYHLASTVTRFKDSKLQIIRSIPTNQTLLNSRRTIIRKPFKTFLLYLDVLVNKRAQICGPSKGLMLFFIHNFQLSFKYLNEIQISKKEISQLYIGHPVFQQISRTLHSEYFSIFLHRIELFRMLNNSNKCHSLRPCLIFPLLRIAHIC